MSTRAHFEFECAQPRKRGVVRPAGIEPATPSLEGSCSIQLSYGRKRKVKAEAKVEVKSRLALNLNLNLNLLCGMVGAPGFEPGTSCSQSRRATRLRYAPTLTGR